jgi:transcriptional regulator with XRE-family HTH domain
MAVGPPSPRRRLLGEILRKAREARDVSQEEAGRSVKSKNWVYRVETAAAQIIKIGDLDRYLTYLGIDGDVAEVLRDHARSKYSESGVWPQSSDSSNWWEQHPEIESQASVIRAYEPTLINGLLQTPEYMRRVFELSPVNDVEQRVKARINRQKLILGQKTPPRVTILLGEGSLYKHMGDTSMMRGQLEHLLDLARNNEHVTVLVQPFGAKSPPVELSWTSWQFSNSFMSDFASIPYPGGSRTVDDPQSMLLLQHLWEELCSGGASPHETMEILQTRIEDLDR